MKPKILESDYFKLVFETMNEGVMLVDPDGHILAFNDAAEKITGYKASEVMGKPCSILDTDTCTIWSSDRKEKRCPLFKKGIVRDRQCRIRSKNGKPVMLLKNAVVIKKDGEVVGAVETMTDISSLHRKEQELETLKKDISHSHGFMGLLGKSPAMENVYAQIEKAADSDIPVIIYGESGTGKELAAQAIHRLSGRRDSPFLRVNCAALSEHLMESELFGHKKGSFTGAIKDTVGRFEAACGGSLFMDEIGDMPLSMQAKLLRVLQEKEIERVGEHTPIPVDVRIITATNKNLSRLIDNELFRDDLYYRINGFPIHMPALRDHIDDLPILINHYLREISSINNKPIKGLTPGALATMKSYHWPGNVRELINILQYSSVTCNDESISRQHLPSFLLNDEGAPIRSSDTPEMKDKVLSQRRIQVDKDETSKVLEALRLHNFNRTRAAEYLGMSRVGLWKKMKRLGIDV